MHFLMPRRDEEPVPGTNSCGAASGPIRKHAAARFDPTEATVASWTLAGLQKPRPGRAPGVAPPIRPPIGPLEYRGRFAASLGLNPSPTRYHSPTSGFCQPEVTQRC